MLVPLHTSSWILFDLLVGPVLAEGAKRASLAHVSSMFLGKRIYKFIRGTESMIFNYLQKIALGKKTESIVE